MLLEVVAEREIAEHLEEGVVARGEADIVEVVVLAAGAHAFLRRGGALVVALFDAGEDVLELHHAGIGEHQRRIVARHQRRGGHFGVAVLLEEAEEGGPDVVHALHGKSQQEKGGMRAAGEKGPSIAAVGAVSSFGHDALGDE